MSEQQQHEDDATHEGWLWAAAAATASRERRGGAAWGAGDHVAELMLLRACKPDRLEGLLPGGQATIPQPKLQAAALPGSWTSHLEALWERLNVRLDVDTLEVGYHRVTPYHLEICKDERHPCYISRERRERPIPPSFVRAIRIVGGPFRPLVVQREPDRFGFGRLWVRAGCKRTLGTRLANDEALLEAVVDLGVQGMGAPPPQLVRFLDVQLKDPLAASVHAHSDHDHQDLGSPMERARECRRLAELEDEEGRRLLTQGQIAELKGISQDTLANYLSLLKLHPDVQVLVESDTIPPAIAYRLVKVPTGKQLWLWQRIAALSNAARHKAISDYLAGEPIERQPTARPTVRKLQELAECWSTAESGSHLHGVQLGIRIAAGDRTALRELPRRQAERVTRILNGDQG